LHKHLETDPILKPSTKHSFGFWLYLHRGWGIVPLVALGLVLNFHELSVQNGYLMMLAGAVGVFAGTLLRIVCVTFVGPISKQRKALSFGNIITDGPYALTRNPMYLADSAIALGVAMMSRMPWLVLVALLIGAAITALIIEWEEYFLRHYYGQIYIDYCKSVPRWFSLHRLFHTDSYFKTRGRVKLMSAVRAESLTLLIGLIAILSFIAKAYLDIYL
jgi:protein-S-isoprenylcysteine O-methyltransferase Ste14